LLSNITIFFLRKYTRREYIYIYILSHSNNVVVSWNSIIYCNRRYNFNDYLLKCVL